MNGRSTTRPTPRVPQIEQIANVAAATVEGGKIRQININLDPALLQARGGPPSDVVKAVKASTRSCPQATSRRKTDYNVFTNTQFKTVDRSTTSS